MTPAQVRWRGAAFAAISAIGAALYFRYLRSGHSDEMVKHGYLAAGPFIPFVYFFTELVAGRTVPDLSSSWDELKGWQRGVLGCGLVGFIFFLLMIVLFAIYM